MRTLLKPVWDYVLELYDLLVGGWGRFWFSPADPTTLAFVRICTGLVLTYIYATCVFEVDNLIGPNAFVDREAVQKLRNSDELLSYLPQLQGVSEPEWRERLESVRPEHLWYFV